MLGCCVRACSPRLFAASTRQAFAPPRFALPLDALPRYDTGFKFNATVHMMDAYGALLRGVMAQALGGGDAPALTPTGSRALGTALDRLTVQFLNSEEVMCR